MIIAVILAAIGLFILAGVDSRIAALHALLERAISDVKEERSARAREAAETERDRRARDECLLCAGAGRYYGGACVYCLGYGQARRTVEADARLCEFAAQVRSGWSGLIPVSAGELDVDLDSDQPEGPSLEERIEQAEREKSEWERREGELDREEAEWRRRVGLVDRDESDV